MFPNGFAAEAGRRRGRDKGKNNREKLGLKSPTIASFHVRSNRAVLSYIVIVAKQFLHQA